MSMEIKLKHFIFKGKEIIFPLLDILFLDIFVILSEEILQNYSYILKAFF